MKQNLCQRLLWTFLVVISRTTIRSPSVLMQPLCILPPMLGPSVLVQASSWAPASNISTVEHPKVSTGPTATDTSPVGSLAVTIAAPQVVDPVLPPAPAIPAAVMEAFEALLGTCRSVGVTEPKILVEKFRAAKAWVRQSSHYASLVRRNQEVKEALVTNLEENAKVPSTSMAANMDTCFVLNLTDAENSFAGSSASGQSPACKLPRVGAPAGPSV